MQLSEDADETFFLKTPPNFGYIGQFYENFAEVKDDEIMEILKQ